MELDVGLLVSTVAYNDLFISEFNLSKIRIPLRADKERMKMMRMPINIKASYDSDQGPWV